MQPEPIYSEREIRAYNLPDPLRAESGEAVKTPGEWRQRRGALLELFAGHLYGLAPDASVKVVKEGVIGESGIQSGRVLMRQIALTLDHDGRSRQLGLLLFLPADTEGPRPVFLGLNFYGNHTVHPDPRILLPDSWSGNSDQLGITDNRATEASRGKRAHRWPVEMILSRGYALATAYAGDLDPDFDDGFQNGVHGLFRESAHSVGPEGRWGTIAAWSWGLSRILDYIGTDPALDAARVIAVGHSRMGKAALWAGATDERFAAVIANASGCAGAALSRRRFGERLIHLNTRFPHWLCGKARDYHEREAELPVDQHELIALMAPRPVHIGSAADDLWADPRGEFLSLVHADPVYRLLGLDGLAAKRMPGPGEAIRGRLSYHIRPGEHDLLEADWHRFLDFADDANLSLPQA